MTPVSYRNTKELLWDRKQKIYTSGLGLVYMKNIQDQLGRSKVQVLVNHNNILRYGSLWQVFKNGGKKSIYNFSRPPPPKKAKKINNEEFCLPNTC